MSLREEETSTLIWKQNDCSENFIVNGDSSVLAADLGSGSGGDCDTLPFPPQWQPGLNLDSGGGGTESSAPTRCFSFGDMCPGFSGTVPVSYNLIIFNEGNLSDI